MDKKYIITLADEYALVHKLTVPVTINGKHTAWMQTDINLTPYTEPDLEQVRKEAYEQGQKDLRESCVPQDEEAYGIGYNEGFQCGLDSAWDAAKKIARMDTETSENVTGYFGLFRIMENLTPMQAIEKLKAYEQEKEEIKVGDEVIPRETEYDTMIVTRLWKDDYDSDCIDAIGFDGKICSFLVSRVSKTGKHYEIAAVLEKMRGE